MPTESLLRQCRRTTAPVVEAVSSVPSTAVATAAWSNHGDEGFVFVINAHVTLCFRSLSIIYERFSFVKNAIALAVVGD